MTIEKQVDASIDIRGQICPYTLIETRDKMKEMTTGQVLEVICDYEPAAKETIPNFCNKKGYPFDTIEVGPSLWHIRIQRTD